MPEPANTYSISELASEFDITTRTIRFYEDEGLLTPTREGQKRIYDEKDRVRLILILRGKRLGFSLQESRDLIELYDPTSGNVKQLRVLLEKITDKKLQLENQLSDIKIMQKELHTAEANILSVINGSSVKAQKN